MRRKSYRPYFLLSVVLFGCINLKPSWVDPFRMRVAGLTAPTWKKLTAKTSSLEERIKKLEAEKGEILRENNHLRNQFKPESEDHLIDFARVIYREPSSWGSTLWIDVGRDSKIAKVNSPVLSGNHLIGVIEKVGKKQSRVRLLTDSALVVSVRVERGNLKNHEISSLVDHLLPFVDAELQSQLATFQKSLDKGVGQRYLAKGELSGTSSPLWRCRSPVLKGIGFNYDFEDEKGPARELRSGKPYGALHQGKEEILVQEGDLLVTTGFDGVFPEDIPVAIVSKVLPLKEGAISYSLEAKLCATSIEELSTVVVLPPRSFEHEICP